MSQQRRPRELRARPASSRRAALLALVLLAAVAALALWLVPGRRSSDATDESVAPQVEESAQAARGEHAQASPSEDPSAASELRIEATTDDAARPPVELVVRLVETVVLEPRPGERRPMRRGVPGMSVTWDDGPRAQSDADGLARFAALPARAGELRVEPQGGLHGWSGTLDLATPSGGLRRSGSRLTFEVELRANLGFFHGILLDAAGAPVDAAWVALVRGGSQDRRAPADGDLLAPAVQSDAHGGFELPRVQGEERLELLISTARAGLPAGHVRPLSTGELASQAPVEVRLPPARGVTVRVLAPDGSPAPGRLCLQRDGAQWPADCEGRLLRTPACAESRARADPPGELCIELDDGPWVVHFLPSQPGASRRLFQFTLAPGGETRFEFRLP